MKYTVICLGILLCGCKPAYHADTPASENTASSASSAAASGSPNSGTAVSSAPTPHHYAPSGVFFLTHPVSITSSVGVNNLPPGTKVIQMQDGTFYAGGDRLSHITKSDLTNDIDLAEQLRAHSPSAK